MDGGRGFLTLNPGLCAPVLVVWWLGGRHGKISVQMVGLCEKNRRAGASAVALQPHGRLVLCVDGISACCLGITKECTVWVAFNLGREFGSCTVQNQ